MPTATIVLTVGFISGLATDMPNLPAVAILAQLRNYIAI